ncbi:hypothetical protein FJW10_07430 [Mesorhizobium sp. B4-1-1]|nr:hypothetical protein FJW10_07430 [Mesorhizobium sp. B4-1-1]
MSSLPHCLPRFGEWDSNAAMAGAHRIVTAILPRAAGWTGSRRHCRRSSARRWCRDREAS